MRVALKTNDNPKRIKYIILGWCSLPETWNRSWVEVAIPPEINICLESSGVPNCCPDFETKVFRIVCNYGEKFLIVERPTDTKYLPGFDDRTNSQICFDNLVKGRKKMILSQTWVKLLPLFPLGVKYVRGQEQPNGIWQWNKKRIRWHNGGNCPHCGNYQTWNINHDDSYIVGVGYFKCKVSCRNPECAKQISIILSRYGVFVD